MPARVGAATAKSKSAVEGMRHELVGAEPRSIRPGRRSPGVEVWDQGPLFLMNMAVSLHPLAARGRGSQRTKAHDLKRIGKGGNCLSGR